MTPHPIASPALLLPITAAALLAAPAAADIQFDDFSNTTGIKLNGTTSQSGNRLRITNGQKQKAGSAWHLTKQFVQSGYETTFVYQTAASGTSDGFAFVLHNEEDFSLGNCNGGLGYSFGTGLCTTGGPFDILGSVVVEFDTAKNNSYNDPNDNHISLHVQTTSEPSANHVNSLGQVTAGILNINDGQPHTVRITYDEAKMEVFVDDLMTPVLSAAINIPSLVNLDQGRAFVGFTGSNGNFGGAVQEILSWSFTEFEGLRSDTDQISVMDGGICNFDLIVGPDEAFLPYVILGNISGTSPGLPLNPAQTLPLNIDTYFFFTLTSPNTPPYAGTFGALNMEGQASASLTVPSNAPVSLVGQTVNHAAVVLELLPTLLDIVFISEPVPLTFVP